MSEADRPHELLVVDDSVATASMIRMLLERSGYRVRVAHSGPAALEELARSTPDLILCDIEMPDLDGFKVVERIRENPQTERLPVILVTSKANIEDKVRGLDTGATDYVTKPFKIEELKARIRTHLRVKMLQDELIENNVVLAQTRRLLEEKIEALRGAYQKIAEHQRRMERALELASRVQRGLLPAHPPEIPGFRASCLFRPAEAVAGDFYDFIDLGAGRCGIAIGDVAGKGVGASLVMVLVRTILRSVAASIADPAQVLARVNQLVIRDYGSQEATTLFYGILDSNQGSFSFSNGGHEFPILASHETGQTIDLTVGGPFLGIFPRARYNRGEIYLASGDQLTLFTDGLYSLCWGGARVESGECVAALLRQAPAVDAEELLHRFGSAECGTAAPAAGTPAPAPASTPGQGTASTAGGTATADDITLIRIVCESARPRGPVGSVVIHNSPVNLREVRSHVGGLARLAGLSETAASDVVESVAEVVTNAVQHAYDGENTGTVDVSVRRENGHVQIVVADRGKGFCPAGIAPAPKAPESGSGSSGSAPSAGAGEAGELAIRADRGRGLRVAARLVDRMDIASSTGSGTSVSLTKRIA
jgi:sigma-B regulation protein RsbU (phosphoserine phosphatase)